MYVCLCICMYVCRCAAIYSPMCMCATSLPGASLVSKWLFPASVVPPWCLASRPMSPFLPPWCLQAVQLILSCLRLPGASLVPCRLSNESFPASLVPRKLPNGSFLPPWCLPGASQALPGASLSNGIQSALASRPWRPPQDLPRTGPFAIEIALTVRQNPTPFQNRDSIGNPVLQVSLVPPWCLPSCPNGSFLPPWCLPGASQAVQLILSCLPGAYRLSN